MVTKGYDQAFRFDFSKTFSPLVKQVTIRIIPTVALFQRWKKYQLDINKVFLYGTLNKKVYMSQPEGFEDFNHPIYDLK